MALSLAHELAAGFISYDLVINPPQSPSEASHEGLLKFMTSVTPPGILSIYDLLYHEGKNTDFGQLTGSMTVSKFLNDAAP